MECGHCGASSPDGARFCGACGTSLAQQPKACASCGPRNDSTANFCIQCGKALSAAPPADVKLSAAQPELPKISAKVIAPANVVRTATKSAFSERQIITAVALIVGVLLLIVLGSLGDSSTPEDTGSPEGMVRGLGLMVAIIAIGGAIVSSIVIESLRARYITAAVIGLAAILFFDSAASNPLSGSLVSDMLFGMAGTASAAGASSAFFQWWAIGFTGPELRAWLRAILIPSAWSDAANTQPLPAKDLVSRWFVTCAASTGSVVGALMTQPEFWHAAKQALAPTHLIFTLLLMVVSITLIGPLEEYIFGQRLGGHAPAQDGEEHGAARGLIEDVWENFSPRAAGRLGLVFLFSLQPTLLDSCVGETVSRGDASATFLILSAAIGPALTTYYWSAALQRNVPSVMKRAGWSSTILTSLIWYPLCLIFIAALMLLYLRSFDIDSHLPLLLTVLAVPISVGVAVAWGFILNGILAYVGGWALDYVRVRHEIGSWKAVALLGGTIFAADVVIFAGIIIFMLATFGGEAVRSVGIGQTMLGTISILGWTAGLALSGFPKILHTARSQALPYRPN